MIFFSRIEQAEKDAAAMQAMQQSTPVQEEKKAQGPFSALFSS